METSSSSCWNDNCKWGVAKDLPLFFSLWFLSVDGCWFLSNVCVVLFKAIILDFGKFVRNFRFHRLSKLKVAGRHVRLVYCCIFKCWKRAKCSARFVDCCVLFLIFGFFLFETNGLLVLIYSSVVQVEDKSPVFFGGLPNHLLEVFKFFRNKWQVFCQRNNVQCFIFGKVHLFKQIPLVIHIHIQ